MASSGSQPPAAPAAPGGPAGSQPGVITISRVQRQADELETAMAALGRRVAGAEAETLRQLQLLDAAAQGLEASAVEAAGRRDELLSGARRLAVELRGLDLLAGHVKAVDELVKRLEAQAADVLASAGAAQ